MSGPAVDGVRMVMDGVWVVMDGVRVAMGRPRAGHARPLQGGCGDAGGIGKARQSPSGLAARGQLPWKGRLFCAGFARVKASPHRGGGRAKRWPEGF